MVGMSGGVDSSTVAAILVQKGYDVCGVTLRLFNEDFEKSVSDAKKVAEKLGIKHEVLDIKQDFCKNVIDYFANEYINGKTPNPCVECNKKIKFGKMLDYALEKGYEFIATGHYANLFYDKNLNRWLIKKSKSPKDQSYFLYGLTQYQLSHSMFPLGDYEKPYVRKLAQKYDLPVFSNSESQDICFIKNSNHAEFIEKYMNIKTPGGFFVNRMGENLGTHKGIINYTVGQRKGLGVALGEPAYVLEIDAAQNKIILGGKEQGKCNKIIIQNTNFILFDVLSEKIRARAKIRYRASEMPCVIEPLNDDAVMIEFDEPIYFPSPGQSVVFYNEEGVVIGGGIISLKN